MMHNVTFTKRWIMVSDFDLWEVVLLTILFSLLVFVAAVGNAIVCILLRLRYTRCARYIKSVYFREAYKMVKRRTHREHLSGTLWDDERPSSHPDCNCKELAQNSKQENLHETILQKNSKPMTESRASQPKNGHNQGQHSERHSFGPNHPVPFVHHRRTGREPSITSLFLFNLSLADFLMAILCIPPYIVTEIAAFFWPFGETLCKLINYFQGISVFVNSLTHVVIALDRFVLVYFPLRPRIQHRTAVALLVGVWFFSCLIPLPIMIVNHVELSETGTYCVEDWSLLFSNLTTRGTTPSREYFLTLYDGELILELRSTYTVILMFLQYFLPLGIICGTYSAIAVRVSGSQTPGEQDLHRDENLIRGRKKMIKMLIIVAVMYGLSHLPHHALYLHGSIHRTFWKQSWSTRLWALATLIRNSSTCYNPFIYAWTNKNFRKDVQHLFILMFLPCWLLRLNRQTNETGRLPGILGRSFSYSGNTFRTTLSRHQPTASTSNRHSSNAYHLIQKRSSSMPDLPGNSANHTA
ncbi:RYamide receptor [Clonorchis sinensis]|uniref:RYamide receptor n=1 Tax=Clonorchis sinensis TaxID=79923 RepID=A0A3R7GPH2_CLOSI|nr:RYamide receptor [Clonorchis sinensis]